jgi:hypothetical protein
MADELRRKYKLPESLDVGALQCRFTELALAGGFSDREAGKVREMVARFAERHA